jgi:signal-transduction protein with cAMP-binding, CBS, and nucleotidyltransferase domain
MGNSVKEVMSTNLIALDTSRTALDAAIAMATNNVGDVVVTDSHGICGIVTDRDLVIRVLAADKSTETTLGEICSKDLETLRSTDTVDDAITIMREHAVRRLPVVENNQPIGIVTLGDLALERDPQSVLGAVSGAPPSD